MGCEVSLVGIHFQTLALDISPLDKLRLPRVMEEVAEIGGSRLQGSLEYISEALAFLSKADPGSEFGPRAFYLRDPLAAANHIQEHHPKDDPHGWWEGLNCPEEVMERLQKHPEYHWWFHVNY